MNSIETKLYKNLLHSGIEEEQDRQNEWLESVQKLIDIIERHPQVGILVPDDFWTLDLGTLMLVPNPKSYTSERLDLLRGMLREANKDIIRIKK